MFENPRIDILSFQFNLIRASGGMESVRCTGAYFSPEVKKLIESCTPGDTVLVDEIRARVPGDVVYETDPIRLVVE